MINLLPEDRKITVKAESRRRLAFVGLTLGGILLAVFAGTLLSFRLLLGADMLESERIVAAGEEDVDAKASRDIIEDLAYKLIVLNLPENTESVAALLETVIEHKTDSISLREFSFGSEKEINLKGIAETREDLTSFLASLKVDPKFDSVKSPVSNLSSGIDIDFAITVTLSDEKD